MYNMRGDKRHFAHINRIISGFRYSSSTHLLMWNCLNKMRGEKKNQLWIICQGKIGGDLNMQWIHIKGKWTLHSKIYLKCGDFWFNCTAYGSSVVRLPWEHREKWYQPSFPTQSHCKHSHLKLQIQLEEWIHLPVLLDKCCTRYNTHSILYSVHLYFCLSLHIFMLFSEKITSACKKLNKESEHKNFVYTYSWTCHVLLIQM